MRTIRIIILFLVAMTVCSCITDGPMYMYYVAISFRDRQGDDLVASLCEEKWKPDGDHSRWYGEINPETYLLDIIPSSPYIFEEEDNVIRDSSRPFLQVAKFDENRRCVSNFRQQTEGDGYYYLLNRVGGRVALSGFQNKVTYLLICPSIFGDDMAHEIITYWKDNNEMAESSFEERRPVCTLAVVDGQEIVPEHGEYYYQYIDVTLDR